MDNIETEVVVDSTPSNPILDTPEVSETPEVPETPEVKQEDPIPKGVQKRIDRAVRQKYEAEARSKMLEERVAAMEARQLAPTNIPRSEGMPTIDKFDNFDDYVSAKAAYIANQQIESTLSAREQRQKAENEAAERSKTVDSWNKRVTAASVEMPDFEEVVSSSDVPMTEPMQQAIMESDVGPKLAYFLATNPDDAYRISQMSAVGAIRELGRLEERLASQKPAVKVTNTAAPITPVGTRSAVKKDPGKMSDAEYAKWRKSA